MQPIKFLDKNQRILKGKQEEITSTKKKYITIKANNLTISNPRFCTICCSPAVPSQFRDGLKQKTNFVLYYIVTYILFHIFLSPNSNLLSLLTLVSILTVTDQNTSLFLKRRNTQYLVDKLNSAHFYYFNGATRYVVHHRFFRGIQKKVVDLKHKYD